MSVLKSELVEKCTGEIEKSRGYVVPSAEKQNWVGIFRLRPGREGFIYFVRRGSPFDPQSSMVRERRLRGDSAFSRRQVTRLCFCQDSCSEELIHSCPDSHGACRSAELNAKKGGSSGLIRCSPTMSILSFSARNLIRSLFIGSRGVGLGRILAHKTLPKEQHAKLSMYEYRKTGNAKSFHQECPQRYAQRQAQPFFRPVPVSPSRRFNGSLQS